MKSHARRIRKEAVVLIASVILFSSCTGGSDVTGRYRANFDDAILEFASQHQVILQDRGKTWRGRYSARGNFVTIALEQPYINGQTEQTFEVQGDMLTAVNNKLTGVTGLFLPGGTKFVKVR